VIYDSKVQFKAGQALVVRKTSKDDVLIIGIGITVHEAVKASEELEKFGIIARVLDPFTVKPLDSNAIIDNTTACKRRIVVTVEDHQSAGKLFIK
jgi:transketolase